MSKVFGNVTKLAEGKANEYYVVVGKIDDYTLIYRNAKYEPWVVAWEFVDKGNESYWCQGHYFGSFEDAILYMLYRKTPDRILSAAINICDEEERGDISELLAELVKKRRGLI